MGQYSDAGMFSIVVFLRIVLTGSQTALFLLRVMYLLGVFGPEKPASTEKKLN